MKPWLWGGRATWDDLAVWFIWVPLLLLFAPIFLVSVAVMAAFEGIVRATTWLLKGVA